jgi:hypothetical protein
MAQLANKIEIFLNRKVNFKKEVLLQNDSDGKGDYINEWNLDIPKPTQEQLDSLEEQTNQYEQNLINEQINKETNKKSALNKLKALGLNDDEIKSIIG